MADWALILGASSGFGEAAARALAADGWNVYGVHLDRKSTLGHVDALVSELKATGAEVEFFNVNAADDAKRGEILDHVARRLSEAGASGGAAAEGADGAPQVRLLLHSLAFGTLKPYVGEQGRAGLSRREMEMTLDVMAHSLVYWAQDLVARGLMRRGGRIFSMTSTGDFHAWPSYGAVSAAKAALEAHSRQLALELAPFGVTANAIRAGVTDTPALRKIPGNEQMIEAAARRNPHGRLTTPDDVAQALVLLARPGAAWITGNVIGVDGGEEIAG